MGVRLKWSPRAIGDSQKVYRGTAPFTASNLPDALATVAADASQFNDDTAVEGVSYWYGVSAVLGEREALSDVVRIKGGATVGEPPEPSSPTEFLTSGNGLYRDFSDLTGMYQDIAKTMPVSANNDVIRHWDDQGPDGNHFIVATGGPYYDATEKAVRFGGGGSHKGLTPYVVGDAGQTILARVKFDATQPFSTACLFGSIDASPFSRGWLSVTDGVASLGVGQNGSNTHKDDLARDLRGDGQFHVLAAVWDASNGWIYVDGVLAHSFVRNGVAATTEVNFGARRVAPNSTDLYLDAWVSDLFVDARALSAQEIDDLTTLLA